MKPEIKESPRSTPLSEAEKAGFYKKCVTYAKYKIRVPEMAEDVAHRMYEAFLKTGYTYLKFLYLSALRAETSWCHHTKQSRNPLRSAASVTTGEDGVERDIFDSLVVEEFKDHIDDEMLESLKRRLATSQFAPRVLPAPAHCSAPDTGSAEGFNVRAQERALLIRALATYNGNRSQTARAMGLSLRAVRYKIRDLRVEDSEELTRRARAPSMTSELGPHLRVRASLRHKSMDEAILASASKVGWSAAGIGQDIGENRTTLVEYVRRWAASQGLDVGGSDEAKSDPNPTPPAPPAPPIRRLPRPETMPLAAKPRRFALVL